MTINHNDFMPESGRLRADIGHALERIAGIVGEVDATMTVGEIVRLSYLQGVGDTLHAFGRIINGCPSLDPAVPDGVVDAGSCGESLHALGVMADRDGRIASMLAHPAWKEG